MTLLVACKSCRRQYDVGTMQIGEQVRCACGKAIVVPRATPHEARVKHCASCGGDVAERATQCGYCGSQLRVETLGPACPECFARLPQDAHFCSECGVGIKPELIRTTAIDKKCPRCKGKLVVRELDAVLLTDCTGCGGLWLDAQAFERLVQAKDTKRLASAAVSPGPPKHEHLPDTRTYIPCLVCNKLMERKNFAGCSGVIIDWCRGHGFWFDVKELEAIVRFLEHGGLDKAKRLAPSRPTRPISMPAGSPGPIIYGGPPSSQGGAFDWASFILWTIGDLFL